MLSHELRNPLAPILSAVEILRMLGNEEAEQAEHCRTVIAQQVEHMKRLLDDLLDVSRVSQGKIELRKETCDIAEILRRAIEVSRPLLTEKSQTLDVIGPDEAILVDADPVRLVQVFANLLNNAAKYSDLRGHIALETTVAGSEAVVRVRDDGIGMTHAMLDRAFESVRAGGEHARPLSGRPRHRAHHGAQPGQAARRIGARLQRGTRARLRDRRAAAAGSERPPASAEVRSAGHHGIAIAAGSGRRRQRRRRADAGRAAPAPQARRDARPRRAERAGAGGIGASRAGADRHRPAGHGRIRRRRRPPAEWPGRAPRWWPSPATAARTTSRARARPASTTTWSSPSTSPPSSASPPPPPIGEHAERTTPDGPRG